ncbi:MAG: hypothetical protein H0U52_14570 [Chloroflexi bacterium]|nr:hypothetical protein [Chloroflexota bacterium]
MTTRDAVVIETPACLATSRIVGRPRRSSTLMTARSMCSWLGGVSPRLALLCVDSTGGFTLGQFDRAVLAARARVADIVAMPPDA